MVDIICNGAICESDCTVVLLYEESSLEPPRMIMDAQLAERKMLLCNLRVRGKSVLHLGLK